MITAYHRPKTLDEALTLLAQPNILPLGGGTLLSKPTTDSVEVVDLQALGLDTVKKNGNNLELGATLTLQTLLESEHCPLALKSALKLEAPLNIRNSATVAGTLVACDGRSTFASVLLAMDAKIEQALLDNSKIEYRVSNIGLYSTSSTNAGRRVGSAHAGPRAESDLRHDGRAGVQDPGPRAPNPHPRRL